MDTQNLIRIFIYKPFTSFTVRGLIIEPTYLQALLIVLLVFLLVFSIARIRYLYVHWSLGKSSISFLFWGALLTVLFEGLFLIGGRTIFTEIVGMKDAPKPISTVIDIGRDRLVQVLGSQSEIPESMAKVENSESVIENYKSLPLGEKTTVFQAICQPQ